jgi:hypothetical protein
MSVANRATIQPNTARSIRPCSESAPSAASLWKCAIRTGTPNAQPSARIGPPINPICEWNTAASPTRRQSIHGKRSVFARMNVGSTPICSKSSASAPPGLAKVTRR